MNIIEKTYNFVGALSKRSRTDYIIIHNADAVTCTADDIHQWHLNNDWAGIGYHFFVRKNGEIYRGRPIDTIGSQCLNYNDKSIGICFEGKYQTVDTVMPKAQKQAGIEFVKWLKDNYYPKAEVVRHKDLNVTNCPGQYFPFYEIKNAESEELTMEQYKELDERVSKLESKMIYNYVDENMPEYARPTIQKLVNKGILKGVNENGDLELTDDDLRHLVINDRSGLYGE